MKFKRNKRRRKDKLAIIFRDRISNGDWYHIARKVPYSSLGYYIPPHLYIDKVRYPTKAQAAVAARQAGFIPWSFCLHDVSNIVEYY
jgi:hypothetical protein